MRIGVPKEVKVHEYRVGLIPAIVRQLVRHGHQVMVETGAGAGAGLADAEYADAGAEIEQTVVAAIYESISEKKPLATEHIAGEIGRTRPLSVVMAEKVEGLRARGEASLPSTLGLELAINPFLRAERPEVQAQLGMSGASPADVFAEIRERKNRF